MLRRAMAAGARTAINVTATVTTAVVHPIDRARVRILSPS